MKISNPEKLTSTGIENIIFDWGGVIINIDYDASVRAFNEIGFESFDEHYHQKQQRELFDLFEIGKIPPGDFRAGIREELGNSVSDEQIDTAWGAMLLDMPMERIALIKQLKKKYKLYLLSNTNQIHEDTIVARLDKQLGYPFFSLFDDIYLSHRVGKRKPNADIFTHVLDDNGIQAAKTLFIDDSEQHIDGAAALGINAFYLQKGMDITGILKSWV